MEELKTKRCPKCGCEKPITEFGSNISKPDGKQTWCKPCTNAANHARTLRKAMRNIAQPDLHSHDGSEASPFVQIQPCEIIAEIRTRINWLRNNGWTFEGKLTYTQVKEVAL